MKLRGEMLLYNKVVAGTVILNGKDGSKLFLLQNNKANVDFIMAKTDETHTNLACILEVLKNDAKVDLESIDLVELTTVEYEKEKIPLYVFEIEEEKVNPIETDQFCWQVPANLRGVLVQRSIAGVPVF